MRAGLQPAVRRVLQHPHPRLRRTPIFLKSWLLPHARNDRCGYHRPVEFSTCLAPTTGSGKRAPTA